MDFFNRMQSLDRRILYVLVVVVVSIPFMINISQPIYPTPPVERAFKAIEEVPEGKIVILASDWEFGSRGESEPQAEALITHMFRKGVKFAIFSTNTPLCATVGETVARRQALRFHKKYGVDWVNWGYRPASAAMLQGLPRDIWKIINVDKFGTPLSKIPLMQHVRNVDNVGLIVNISPTFSATLWIDYVQGRYGTPIVFAPTAVMVAETYPWLASGQIRGALPGLRGAAEYETLLGEAGYGRRAMNAQSWAHLLIIALIVLGNISYFASRKLKGAGQ